MTLLEQKLTSIFVLVLKIFLRLIAQMISFEYFENFAFLDVE